MTAFGMPKAAACSTCGWALRTASTSLQYTFSPPTHAAQHAMSDAAQQYMYAGCT